jgi:uroporphyrinogen decarboxylase
LNLEVTEYPSGTGTETGRPETCSASSFSPIKGEKSTGARWGYLWENLGDGTLGQPKKPVIPSWEELDTYVFPDPLRPGRFDGIEQFLEEAEDRYRSE